MRLEGSGFECFCCVCHSKSFKESALQFNVAEERCVYYCCEVIISGRWVGRWVGDSEYSSIARTPRVLLMKELYVQWCV